MVHAVGHDSGHEFTPETIMQVDPRFTRAECEEAQDEVRGLRTHIAMASKSYNHTATATPTTHVAITKHIAIFLYEL